MNNQIYVDHLYFPFGARLGNKRMIMQKIYLKLSSNDFIFFFFLFTQILLGTLTVEKSYRITKLLPHIQKKKT